MKIEIERLESPFLMEATNESGNKILMDGALTMGGTEKGMRPMQLLLTALGGCSSIDVIDILNKQKLLATSYKVTVSSERKKVGEANLFDKILVDFRLEGELPENKVRRAIELSLEKYCSVAKILEMHTEIGYTFSINGQQFDH